VWAAQHGLIYALLLQPGPSWFGGSATRNRSA